MFQEMKLLSDWLKRSLGIQGRFDLSLEEDHHQAFKNSSEAHNYHALTRIEQVILFFVSLSDHNILNVHMCHQSLSDHNILNVHICRNFKLAPLMACD